jgi:hypothetical protein
MEHILCQLLARKAEHVYNLHVWFHFQLFPIDKIRHTCRLMISSNIKAASMVCICVCVCVCVCVRVRARACVCMLVCVIVALVFSRLAEATWNSRILRILLATGYDSRKNL